MGLPVVATQWGQSEKLIAFQVEHDFADILYIYVSG